MPRYVPQIQNVRHDAAGDVTVTLTRPVAGDDLPEAITLLAVRHGANPADDVSIINHSTASPDTMRGVIPNIAPQGEIDIFADATYGNDNIMSQPYVIDTDDLIPPPAPTGARAPARARHPDPVARAPEPEEEDTDLPQPALAAPFVISQRTKTIGGIIVIVLAVSVLTIAILLLLSALKKPEKPQIEVRSEGLAASVASKVTDELGSKVSKTYDELGGKIDSAKSDVGGKVDAVGTKIDNLGTKIDSLGAKLTAIPAPATAPAATAPAVTPSGTLPPPASFTEPDWKALPVVITPPPGKDGLLRIFIRDNSNEPWVLKTCTGEVRFKPRKEPEETQLVAKISGPSGKPLTVEAGPRMGVGNLELYEDGSPKSIPVGPRMVPTEVSIRGFGYGEIYFRELLPGRPIDDARAFGPVYGYLYVPRDQANPQPPADNVPKDVAPKVTPKKVPSPAPAVKPAPKVEPKPAPKAPATKPAIVVPPVTPVVPPPGPAVIVPVPTPVPSASRDESGVYYHP